MGPPLDLLPHHRELIDASAISEDVARDRGYRSVTEARQLAELGFPQSQRRAPGLVIPLRNVYGELQSYQLRPDAPRMLDGRILKYETPRGSSNMLDCPRSTLRHVGDPKVRLWITEGARKADALASVGLRGVSILGVSSWRGRNSDNGLTALPDWHGVALSGRELIICFDSDAFSNPNVHRAVETFGRWLESRGASLAFVYLPHAADGSKLGVDDFLAEHSRDDLLAKIETVWHPLPHQATAPDNPEPDAALRSSAELLIELRDTLRRFVVLPSSAAYLALALWILHSWAFDASGATPYLILNSPTKRAGKTRALEVLELLVRRPWRIAAASESAMFRKIAAESPTLLLDECDALFGRRAEGTEAVRGILNAGNRPGASVARVVGEGSSLEVVDFSVWCPKVLAGISTDRWPDTITDRSIIIRLERKAPDEVVEKLRWRKLEAATAQLRAELARWAAEHVDELTDADPEIPSALDDRQADGWEPLFAVADLAERQDPGTRWSDFAHRAALRLAGERIESDAHGPAALAAIRDLFGRDADHLTTAAILEALNGADELPFGDWRDGKGLTARGLAKLLRQYGIGSQDVGPEAERRKGYRRPQFADAWRRYCPPAPAETDSDPRIRADASNHGGSSPDASAQDAPADGSENQSAQPETPVNIGNCADARIEGAQDGGRTVAHLTEHELLAVFPGAEIIEGPNLESERAICGCASREREWRLTGEAENITMRRVSNADYRGAVSDGLETLPTGKRSGYVVERTPTGRGHPWTCALCHPPAAGLDVEIREAAP